MIETRAPHTTQEAFTDGIGAWGVIRCFQYLDTAGCGHTSKTGTKCVITISDEIRAVLVHRESLPAAVRAVQASVGERVTPTWMTLRECRSMMKKANGERKQRSVTCKKSHAQMSLAWFCRKVAQVCPRGLVVRTALMYF